VRCKSDRRYGHVVVETGRIIDDNAAAPTVDGGVEAGKAAGDEIRLTAAGAKAHDAHLAVAVRLTAKVARGGAHVSQDLGVGHAAEATRAGGGVVGVTMAVAGVKVRTDRREAPVGKLPGDFQGPLVPSGRVVDDYDAGDGAV